MIFPLLLRPPLRTVLTRRVASPLLERLTSAVSLARSLARYSPELLIEMVCLGTVPPRISRFPELEIFTEIVFAFSSEMRISPELEIFTSSELQSNFIMERFPELLIDIEKSCDFRSGTVISPLEEIPTEFNRVIVR